MSEEYDSAEDTVEHMEQVRRFMAVFDADWSFRARHHDESKLVSPEKEAFDEFTPKLAQLKYGTDEYRATLRQMKPALEHHYQHNDHHPEHWQHPVGGLSGMPLQAILEMLCDWKAAGMGHKDNPGLEHSIDVNQARFGYGDEVKAILLATARLLEEQP